MLKTKFSLIFLITILLVGTVSTQLAIAQNESEVPTPTSFVSDYADIFGETEEEDLNNVLAEVLVNSGLQIYLLVVESMNGASISEYGADVMASWGIDEADGLNKQLLFIVSMDEGVYNIITTQGLERYVSDDELAEINNTVILPALARIGDESIEPVVTPEDGIAVAMVLGIQEIINTYKDNLDENTTVHRASGATGMRLTDYLGILMILGLVAILLLVNSISF